MDNPHPYCIYIKCAQYYDHKLSRTLVHTKKAKKEIDSPFSKQPIDNAFMNPNLPLFDLIYGCYRMFPLELLHTLDEGTMMYMIRSFKLTIGDIGPGKTLKNDIENLHHTIHHEIKRNSERDFPRGSQNMPLGLEIFVIFGDKSHLDLKGALSTIPIIFTFTASTRM
jgi:hypothetical protein